MRGQSAERVVVLVDMDCFYVQVEQQLAPETRNLPCAVVQYNTWRGGRYLRNLHFHYCYLLVLGMNAAFLLLTTLRGAVV